MKLKTAKLVSMVLLYISLGFFVATALAMYRMHDALGKGLITAGIVLAIVAVIIRLIWAKCPYCGRHITYKHLKDTTCPYCRRKITGD